MGVWGYIYNVILLYLKRVLYNNITLNDAQCTNTIHIQTPLFST